MALYDFKDKRILSRDKVFAWQRDMYEAAGMNAKDAAVVADNLVESDLRKVYSHGIMRTPIYIGQFEKGEIDPAARPEIVTRKRAVALIDGNNGMGMVVASFAAETAIEMARDAGSATVSVRGSNHLGACAYYAEMAARAGMIGFCWSINGRNIMAPWGGVERQLGNNPLAIAAPCGERDGVVLDMATSVVAKGKILMAIKTGSEIPDTWAIDVDGNPTTDAKTADAGTVLPFGDYKGSGLAFMNAVVTAILNDARFGPDMDSFWSGTKREGRQNAGHLIQVIDIAAITGVGQFKKRMDKAVEYIKKGKRKAGVEEIFVPGEIEARARRQQSADGIAYPEEVIRENRQLAEKYGVAFPF